MADATWGPEFAAIERIAKRLPSAPAGERWIGDDAAIVRIGAQTIVASADALVAGVHFDLTLTSIADAGWKALAVNVSDLAAMGCVATRALVTVSAPPDLDLDGLYEGLAEASESLGCAIVGGDLTSSPVLVVSVSVIGDGAVDPPPVLRAGARAGDVVWVTGPLGAAAAGLRLRRDLEQHARPVPRVAEGVCARQHHATAMIDVSDGLAADLGHILDASGVGVEIDDVPIAPGASRDDAVGGGDDYELVWCGGEGIEAAFAERGLRPPIRIGRVVPDASSRPLGTAGWVHR